MQSVEVIATTRKNSTKAEQLTPDGRRRLSESARKNQPWKRGTGPKTEEGKRRSRMNALKHGRCSAEQLLHWSFLMATRVYFNQLRALGRVERHPKAVFEWQGKVRLNPRAAAIASRRLAAYFALNRGDCLLTPNERAIEYMRYYRECPSIVKSEQVGSNVASPVELFVATAKALFGDLPDIADESAAVLTESPKLRAQSAYKPDLNHP